MSWNTSPIVKWSKFWEFLTQKTKQKFTTYYKIKIFSIFGVWVKFSAVSLWPLDSKENQLINGINERKMCKFWYNNLTLVKKNNSVTKTNVLPNKPYYKITNLYGRHCSVSVLLKVHFCQVQYYILRPKIGIYSRCVKIYGMFLSHTKNVLT